MNYEVAEPHHDWGAPAQSGGVNLGLNEIFSILRRRIGVLTISFLILFMLTAAYAFTKPAEYTANSIVMVEPRYDDDDAVLISERVSAAEEIKISTVAEVMKSRNLAEKLVLVLSDDLEQDKKSGGMIASVRNGALGWLRASKQPIDPANADQQKFEAATDRLQRDIAIKRLSRSRMIEITAKAGTPDRAARKANAQVEIYLDTRRRERQQSRKKKIEALEQQVEEMRVALVNADLAVAKYMRKNNLISDRQDAAVLSRIARLEAARTEARTQSISRTLNQLMEEEAEIRERLARLSGIYGSGYPEIVDLREQLFALELKIATERQRMQTRSSTARAQLDESAASLQNEIRSVRRQHFAALEANAGLKELEREAESRLSQFNGVRDRLQRAKNALYQDRDDIRVMAKAIVPNTPANFGAAGLLAVGSLGSLALAFLFAFGVEAFDNNVRSSDHVRQLMGASTLSMVPRAPGRRIQPDAIREYLAENPEAEFTGAIRNLYLELASSAVSHTPRIVIVTSVLPDEGKTTIANGLTAMAGFFDQRAMMISIDGGAHEGADVQQQSADLQSDNGSEQAGGGAPGNSVSAFPTGAVRSMSLRELPSRLEEMGERWDMIIIDAPPILKSRDAKLLAAYAEDVLMVMEWSRTPAGAVRAARDLFEDIEVGVVLNRVNLNAHARLAYGDMVQYSHEVKKRYSFR